MNKHRFHYLIRRSHRFLGLFLGIQFLFWTIGGLYFSWSDMDEIHGDYQKKAVPILKVTMPLAAPNTVLDSVLKTHNDAQITHIQLFDILGKPTYRVEMMHEGHHKMHVLADATSGAIRPPLSEKEAIALAKIQFNGDLNVENVAYLTDTDGHHEYRESPLPAYAVRFSHPSKTTVYVSTNMGVVTKYRNDKWRIFDFLWMLHTMDYKGRDNFGNVLLRLFSIVGLITICSGFLLFFVSRKRNEADSSNKGKIVKKW